MAGCRDRSRCCRVFNFWQQAQGTRDVHYCIHLYKLHAAVCTHANIHSCEHSMTHSKTIYPSNQRGFCRSSFAKMDLHTYVQLRTTPPPATEVYKRACFREVLRGMLKILLLILDQIPLQTYFFSPLRLEQRHAAQHGGAHAEETIYVVMTPLLPCLRLTDIS